VGKRAKTKKELSVLIEIIKRPSRAVRVDVTVVKAEWQEFIVQ
jgi:hypothetical protein